MMILPTLVVGDAHGNTIAKVIERSSEDGLNGEQGVSGSGAASAGKPGAGEVLLGDEQEQSEGEVLSADDGGAEAVDDGDEPAAADGSGNWAGDR